MKENKEKQSILARTIPEEVKPLEVEPPSMFSMIKSFGKDLGKWVSEGAPATTPADYIERLTACNNCPHLQKKHMRCGKCGCMVEHKAKWRTTTCPDTPTRWKPQDATPKTKQEKVVREQQIFDKENEEVIKALQEIKKSEGKEMIVTRGEVEDYKKQQSDKGYVEFEDVPE